VAPGRPAALLFAHVSDPEESSSVLPDLAVAISRRVGGEMIIVDARFQSCRSTDVLGVESERTLWDVLAGAADWRAIVQRTKASRISLLPGGPSAGTPRPPQEALQPARLLDELRSEYDLVLVEGARVGSTAVGALARHCDATYLTVQLNRVSRRQVRRAASMLQRYGAALLGCVVIGS